MFMTAWNIKAEQSTIPQFDGITHLAHLIILKVANGNIANTSQITNTHITHTSFRLANQPINTNRPGSIMFSLPRNQNG